VAAQRSAWHAWVWNRRRMFGGQDSGCGRQQQHPENGGAGLKDQGIDVVAVGNGEAAVRKISDIIPDFGAGRRFHAGSKWI